MQQAKGYADCRRHDVKYVFAANGHRYGEFDMFTRLQTGPFPFFGFTKTGDILDDGLLPIALTKEWVEEKENQGKPFPTFACLLSKYGTKKGESRYSWTVDFIARRAKAREEMKPHLDKVKDIKARVVTLKEQLKAHKKQKAFRSVIIELQQQIKTQEKKARKAQVKANAIDASVYDLKAVNPNAIAKVDTRTPMEVIENIEAQGEIVSAALAKLKTLMAEPN